MLAVLSAMIRGPGGRAITPRQVRPFYEELEAASSSSISSILRS